MIEERSSGRGKIHEMYITKGIKNVSRTLRPCRQYGYDVCQRVLSTVYMTTGKGT